MEMFKKLQSAAKKEEAPIRTAPIWRSLMLRMFVVAKIVVLSKALQLAEARARGKKKHQQKRTPTSNMGVVGKEMPRSTQREYHHKPESCPGHGLKARGNGAQKWFTCDLCGMRWERVDAETEQRASAPHVPVMASTESTPQQTAPRLRRA